MQRLFVAWPLYQSIPAEMFNRWLEMDHSPVVGTRVIRNVYLPAAMNMIVLKALEQDNWDRLLIFEADMIPPENSLLRIAQYPPQYDIVGSLYFQHDSPHHALAYIEQPDLSHVPVAAGTVKNWCAQPAVYQVDSVGFGYTSIARHVLENWDPNILKFSAESIFGSHDLYFCHHARRQGFRVYIDSGIVCEHLTQIPVGLDHNQSAAHKPELHAALREAELHATRAALRDVEWKLAEREML